MTYILWFGLCLVFFMRTYGLYRPIQQMSGLHELRMTAHACVVAGLTLCGTLYLSSGAQISRIEIYADSPNRLRHDHRPPDDPAPHDVQALPSGH